MQAPARQKKSDRTREAIAQSARRLFVQNGYERTTIRDVAADTGVDPALVMRYFGSKEQLFARVAEFRLALPDLTAIDRADIGETLVRHFLDVWEGGDGASGLPILLRSAVSNEMAAAQMQRIFGEQVMPVLVRVADRETAVQRAGLVASQLLGMALCRYLLKLPPMAAMPRDRLVAMVGRMVQQAVTGPLP